jgi:hypothetical protein
MNSWPEHYPKQCPPENAYLYNGVLFRFINKSNPVARDFKSYYEITPEKEWGDQACQARGLSVVKSLTGVSEMRNAIPALRRKKVSSATISHIHGLLADTPSSSSKRHCTWWMPSSLINPENLFQTANISEIEYV